MAPLREVLSPLRLRGWLQASAPSVQPRVGHLLLWARLPPSTPASASAFHLELVFRSASASARRPRPSPSASSESPRAPRRSFSASGSRLDFGIGLLRTPRWSFSASGSRLDFGVGLLRALRRSSSAGSHLDFGVGLGNLYSASNSPRALGFGPLVSHCLSFLPPFLSPRSPYSSVGGKGDSSAATRILFRSLLSLAITIIFMLKDYREFLYLFLQTPELSIFSLI